MKLFEIKQLREEASNYIVYSVSAPGVGTYYGFADDGQFPNKTTNDRENILRAFISDSKKESSDGAESKRGSSVLIAQAGGVDNLTVDMLDVFSSASEAKAERNKLRAERGDSINGPTAWPIIPDESDESKAAYQTHKMQHALRKELNQGPARAATDSKYDGLSAYKYSDIQQLVKNNPSAKRDYLSMSYLEFATKYFPDQMK